MNDRAVHYSGEAHQADAPGRSERAGSRTVLVVGNYRPTLSVVRSLGRAGYRVIIGRDEASSAAEYSRYAAEVWQHPSIRKDGPGFVAALAAFLEQRPDIGFVFPMLGLALIRLCEHRDLLPEGVVVVMPEPALVELCDHKTRLLEIAAELGVPQPGLAVVGSMAELEDAVRATGFPCIVKPAVAELRLDGEKGFICADEAELRRRLPAWPEGHASLLVQRYVTGLRHNLHFAARDGRLLRCLDAVSLRTQRPDGTGVTVEGISVDLPDDMRAYCERLLARVSYTGIGCMQFLRDERDGAAVFLEINPRLAAGYGISQHCGLDLPVLAMDLARGAPIPELDDPVIRRAGQRFAWTSGDLEGLKKAVRQREVGLKQAALWLGDIARSAFRADMHLTWRWHDPRPTLALYARMLRRSRR
jgi:predicted ATP-grasp superfamily ATP-dependent carboligase